MASCVAEASIMSCWCQLRILVLADGAVFIVSSCQCGDARHWWLTLLPCFPFLSSTVHISFTGHSGTKHDIRRDTGQAKRQDKTTGHNSKDNDSKHNVA